MNDPREEAVRHNQLGADLASKGDHQGALEAFDRATQLDPAMPSYLSNRGLMKYRMRDFDGAVEDHRKAIDVAPGYSAARVNLGDALAAAGRYEEAIASYRAALDLGDKDAAAIGSAMQRCREALKQERGDSDVVIHRGPFRTRMSEKRFLGCLGIWALLIIGALAAIFWSGILEPPGLSQEIGDRYGDALWQDAQRYVREQFEDQGGGVAFLEKPRFLAGSTARSLAVSSIIEHTDRTGKEVRWYFYYETSWDENGRLRKGELTLRETDT